MGKRRIFVGLLAAVLCLLLAAPVLATNRITDIFVDVTLRPDGSAYLVQTWNGSFGDGTECYFPVANLGDMTLSGLIVSDKQGAFTTLDGWDTEASFEEKARKCALNPVDGGYEICWGISNYGENRYAVEYLIGGLAAAYDDYDGFLFQFVPSGMNTGPIDVTVRIVTQDGTALTEENTAIWAFGFDGQIGFAENGRVFAYTEEALTEKNSMIVMLQLNKGVLTPTRAVSGSFEEVKTGAFEGSDYSGDEGLGWGFWSKALMIGGAAVALFLWICGKEGRQIKKLYKDVNYWRDAPIGGNLEASFVLARRFRQTDDDGNIVAAVLTKLLANGCLEPITTLDVGFMEREQKSVSLRLIKPPTFRSVTAEQLYALLEKAAGNDGILQENELEAYCKRNYQSLIGIVKEAQRDGGETLASIECYKSLLDTQTLGGLTERGHTLLLQIMGYKKHLLEFSLIAERGANQALIWQNCLTYAALLGIGKQVLKELKKHYSGVNTQIQTAEGFYYVAYRYNRVTYQAAKSAAAAAQRTSGGGGSSSFGGGGGFSGGGSGGGTR